MFANQTVVLGITANEERSYSAKLTPADADRRDAWGPTGTSPGSHRVCPSEVTAGRRRRLSSPGELRLSTRREIVKVFSPG